MSDAFQWWQDALAGKKPPQHPDSPEAGFYRYRTKDKASGAITFLPVAYYFHDGILHCRVGDKDVSVETGQGIWTYTGQYPVTEAAYRDAAERGLPWPDQDQTVHDQQADDAARRGSGGNNPPQDEVTILDEQIKSAAAGADDYKTITSDEQMMRGQSLRSRLLELRRSADNHEEAEKRPHLDATKTIRDKWKPLIDAADTAAKAIAKAMGLWNDKKERDAQEAARKAEADRRAAEEAGRPAPPPPPVAAPATQVKGAYGRAANIKKVPVAHVIDQDAAYLYVKQQAVVIEAISKAAQQLVDAGHTVPGVRVEQESRVK